MDYRNLIMKALAEIKDERLLLRIYKFVVSVWRKSSY